jgi:hypothetical protein
MSNGELKYKWQPEFQEAVVEVDRKKLIEKIQKFETAVFVRLQELKSSSDHHAEREAIADAASTIAALKKNKLLNTDGQ